MLRARSGSESSGKFAGACCRVVRRMKTTVPRAIPALGGGRRGRKQPPHQRSTRGLKSTMELTRVCRFVGCLGLTGVLAVAVGGCRSTPTRPVAVAADVTVSTNPAAPFAVGVVPTSAPPIRIGTPIGFRLSSSLAGVGHLYLINAVGGVTVLAENLPVAAGSQLDFPDPVAGFTVTATRPAGINRVILLVTLAQFTGFANTQGASLRSPVPLTLGAEEFLRRLDDATGSLPEASWATDEVRVQVVG